MLMTSDGDPPVTIPDSSTTTSRLMLTPAIASVPSNVPPRCTSYRRNTALTQWLNRFCMTDNRRSGTPAIGGG